MCWPDPLGLDMDKKMQDWSKAILPGEQERYDAILDKVDPESDEVWEAIEAMGLDPSEAFYSDLQLMANKLAYDQMVAELKVEPSAADRASLDDVRETVSS